MEPRVNAMSAGAALCQIVKHMAGVELVGVRNKTHTSVDQVSCTVLSVVEHTPRPLPSVLGTSC